MFLRKGQIESQPVLNVLSLFFLDFRPFEAVSDGTELFILIRKFI